MYNLGYRDLFPKLDGGKYPLTQTMIIELGILAAVVLVSSPFYCTHSADPRSAQQSSSNSSIYSDTDSSNSETKNKPRLKLRK